MSKKFWIHSSNERKYQLEHQGKADHLFHKRWFIHLGDSQEISIEGVTSWPDIFSFQISCGGDNDLSIAFWFIFTWYVSLRNLPRKFMRWFENKLPRYQYSREISLRFFGGGMWWHIWSDSDSWNNKTPKWRNGSFNPIKKIKGKCKNITEYLGFDKETIYFKEGRYKIVSIRNVLIKKYNRLGFLFNKRFARYDVIAGDFVRVNSFKDIKTFQYVIYEKGDVFFTRRLLLEKSSYRNNTDLSELKSDSSIDRVNKINKEFGTVTMNSGDEIEYGQITFALQEKAIPIPGKGTTAYNCGEDAIYSQSSIANNHQESIAKFQASVMRSRNNYGGKEWVPEEYKQA